MNKVVRTIEISADLDAAVQRLAQETAQTPSEVVVAAVEQLLAETDDLTIELERWSEYERSGDALDEDDVRSRIETLRSLPNASKPST